MGATQQERAAKDYDYIPLRALMVSEEMSVA